jgi:hypothetical protein
MADKPHPIDMRDTIAAAVNQQMEDVVPDAPSVVPDADRRGRPWAYQQAQPSLQVAPQLAAPQVAGLPPHWTMPGLSARRYAGATPLGTPLGSRPVPAMF